MKQNEQSTAAQDWLTTLGRALLDAQKKSQEEFDVLEGRLLCQGMSQAELRAAKAVAQGMIDRRLIFAGVCCSKILSLKPQEHKRLLSNEKFDLKTAEGTIVSKTWEEMSAQEKDQLLGKRGCRIRPPAEQVVEAVRNRSKR